MPPIFTHISGICPPKEFPLKYTSFILGICPKNRGIPYLPKRLKLMSRNSKLFNLTKLPGIFPEIPLKLKIKLQKPGKITQRLGR
uniref:Uncharacterized protein n=1 Tax=Rhizophora mucronata TaxID=61149 RepID=A0A2P2P8I2_RHIMU